MAKGIPQTQENSFALDAFRHCEAVIIRLPGYIPSRRGRFSLSIIALSWQRYSVNSGNIDCLECFRLGEAVFILLTA